MENSMEGLKNSIDILKVKQRENWREEIRKLEQLSGSSVFK